MQPNVNSPSAIRFKDKWNQFDPIQHINLFSSKTIEKIAKVYGFKLVGALSIFRNTLCKFFRKL